MKSICPLCDSTNVEIRHDRKAVYRYLGREHVLEGQEHSVCRDCGTSFYQKGQIGRNNERFLAWSKSIVKHIAPWEILKLREKYDLSQVEASRIFHCGPTQFSKWERGEVAPTGTAALALREALENPDYIKKLGERAGIAVHIETKDQPSFTVATSGEESWMPYFPTAVVAYPRVTAASVRVCTDFLVFDPAATRQRAVSKIFINPNPVRGGYEIRQGALREDSYEIDDWLSAPANVPLVDTPKHPSKKVAKTAHAKSVR